jgi:hypothetical protein
MKFLVNVSSTDSSYVVAPSNFIEIEPDDYFIFSLGSADVADGKPIPSTEQLNAAASIIPDSGIEYISKVFLADVSENLLREIHLLGQNKRYVFCVSFDAPTATEPVLELWDNGDYDTYNFQMLGEGTPANSLIRGIMTNLGLPGEDWIGKHLAGGADDYRLLLNDGSGRLLVAADLYFNLKAEVIPTLDAAIETPRFLIKFYSTP